MKREYTEPVLDIVRFEENALFLVMSGEPTNEGDQGSSVDDAEVGRSDEMLEGAKADSNAGSADTNLATEQMAQEAAQATVEQEAQAEAAAAAEQVAQAEAAAQAAAAQAAAEQAAAQAAAEQAAVAEEPAQQEVVSESADTEE